METKLLPRQLSNVTCLFFCRYPSSDHTPSGMCTYSSLAQLCIHVTVLPVPVAELACTEDSHPHLAFPASGSSRPDPDDECDVGTSTPTLTCDVDLTVCLWISTLVCVPFHPFAAAGRCCFLHGSECCVRGSGRCQQTIPVRLVPETDTGGAPFTPDKPPLPLCRSLIVIDTPTSRSMLVCSACFPPKREEIVV